MIVLLSWLSRDGKLLLAARTIRTFAYGFLSIILAIYLKLIGFSEFYIGLILTASLVNSIILTLIASFYADRIGRRKVLIMYSTLMSLSGAIFFITSNYVTLILSALIGTVNVTGTETGAFLSIEQATLPQTINDHKKRNMLYALYNMVGTFAMSAGILLSGLPQIFAQQYGFNQIESIKPLFLLYSLIGLVITGVYYLLSKKVEADVYAKANNGNVDQNIPKPLKHTLSPNSKEIVTKLSGLFAIDSFAGGFVIQSIVSFWFYTKFEGIQLTTLSYIFQLLAFSLHCRFLYLQRLQTKLV